MLEERLSERTKKNILDSLENRIFNPMRQSFANNTWLKKIQYWEKDDNNWNVVCWSCVAFTALAALPNKTEREFFINKAFTDTQFFFNNLREDGYFNEGDYNFIIS